jgi:hypothetical protein
MRALLAEYTHTLPVFPDALEQASPRRVRVGCRHVELAELSKARLRTGSGGDTRSVGSCRGVDVDASSRSSSGSRYTCGGARERTHYHIVEAKESGAPGMLAQRLGIGVVVWDSRALMLKGIKGGVTDR